MSILCLCFVGMVTGTVLYIVLGCFVLNFKFKHNINDKKSERTPLQWIAGLLLILPIALIIVGVFIIRIQEENMILNGGDFITYYNVVSPVNSLFIVSFSLFYIGSILSTIFIVKTRKTIKKFYEEKSKELQNKKQELTQSLSTK